MREIIADYRPHFEGERETVNWSRPDGEGSSRVYFDVPVMYLREVSAEEYLQERPHMRGQLPPERCYFWEVSVD